MDCIEEEQTNNNNNDIFKDLGTHHQKSLKKVLSSLNKTGIENSTNPNSMNNSFIKLYQPVLKSR